MKHIKELLSKYPIIGQGEDLVIIFSSRCDNILPIIMKDLEDRILSFTNELEVKIDNIYNSIQEKCSTLCNSISKMPSKDKVQPSTVFESIQKLIEIKAESIKLLEHNQFSLQVLLLLYLFGKI